MYAVIFNPSKLHSRVTYISASLATQILQCNAKNIYIIEETSPDGVKQKVRENPSVKSRKQISCHILTEKNLKAEHYKILI